MTHTDTVPAKSLHAVEGVLSAQACGTSHRAKRESNAKIKLIICAVLLPPNPVDMVQSTLAPAVFDDEWTRTLPTRKRMNRPFGLSSQRANIVNKNYRANHWNLSENTRLSLLWTLKGQIT
ncbi:predicted protein [Histoplasma capsulatum var. duboisii H88]|uniref:Predicted protein n=1 Tax=Ajellomyces capsulatus (strain H88) TaxID=544711 RepID=F0U927_AJEC8|nr:predicted protein [Histoplasma capsulatum var. duboisii H88]